MTRIVCLGNAAQHPIYAGFGDPAGQAHFWGRRASPFTAEGVDISVRPDPNRWLAALYGDFDSTEILLGTGVTDEGAALARLDPPAGIVGVTPC